MTPAARCLSPPPYLRLLLLLLLLAGLLSSGEKDGPDRNYAGMCKLYDSANKVDNVDFDCQTALFAKYDYVVEGTLYMILNHDLCSHTNLDPVVAAIELMHAKTLRATEQARALATPGPPAAVTNATLAARAAADAARAAGAALAAIDAEAASDASCEEDGDDAYEDGDDYEDDYEETHRRCLAALAAKQADRAARRAQAVTAVEAAEAEAAYTQRVADDEVARHAEALAEAAAGNAPYVPPAVKVAAVRRGNCSFETKVKVAHASGFAALVIVNNDNVAFPAGAASLKFRSAVPALMAGDSFLAAYKEVAGIRENAPDCVPMTEAMLQAYREAQVNASASTNATDLSPAGNGTVAADVTLDGAVTTGADVNATMEVATAAGGEEGEEPLSPDDPLYDLKRQLREQERLVRLMLASLRQEGIAVQDGVNGTDAANATATAMADSAAAMRTTLQSLYDQLSYQPPPPRVQTINYCLPETVVEPQKVLFVHLRYATSLRYPKVVFSPAGVSSVGVPDAAVEGGEAEPEPVPLDPAEQLRRRRLLTRIVVAVALLAATAAVAALGASLYSTEGASLRDLRDKLLPVVAGLVPFALAFAGFLVLRFGTFRVLSVDVANARYVYNHRETDERIFEALVDAVEARPWDYTLAGHPIVDTLRLAPENYGDRLFIHPPFFVYSMAVLRRLARLPLPGYALLCQVLTLALLPVLAYSVSGLLTSERPLSRFQHMTNGMALWAVVVFAACPVAAFCSQKVWIDNALLFACALAVVAHSTLVAIPRALPAFSVNWNQATMPTAAAPAGDAAGTGPDSAGVERSGIVRKTPRDAKAAQAVRVRSLQRHFLSGFVFFGGIALNCKISALALLPFLLTWSLLQRLVVQLSQIGANLWAVATWEVPLPAALAWLGKAKSGSGDKGGVLRLRLNVVVEDVLAHWLAFAAGTALAHGPWVLLYWLYTARCLPNAWPSPTMLARSPFLQAAAARPWHSYVAVLARVSPVHLVGLAFGAATAAQVVRRLAARLLAGGWVLVAAQRAYTWVDHASRKVNAQRLASPGYKAAWRRADKMALAALAWVQRRTEVRLLDDKDGPVGASSPAKGASATAAAASPGVPEASVWVQHQMQQQALVDLLQSAEVRVAVFALWPAGFLLGHTLLGCAGGTFQTRFILPALPATAVLAAAYVAGAAGSGRLSGTIDKSGTVNSRFVLGGDAAAAAGTTRSAVCALLLAYASLHTLFYGVLYAPMFADLDFSAVGIVAGILRSAYYAPPDRETFETILRFMEHFGLTRKAA